MKYYAYLWLRADGTPYYAGKGKGNRAYVKENHICPPPKDKSRVVLFYRATEQEAIDTEIELIRNWGRKDIGTGCLRNFTDGGDGVSGLRHTEDAKERMSVAKKGKPGHPLKPDHIAAMAAGRVGKKRGPRPPHVLAAMHSPEAIAKSVAARLGRTVPVETREKISQSHMGLRPSEETRQKLSDSHKGKIPWNKGKSGGEWSAARRAAHEDSKCLT